MSTTWLCTFCKTANSNKVEQCQKRQQHWTAKPLVSTQHHNRTSSTTTTAPWRSKQEDHNDDEEVPTHATWTTPIHWTCNICNATYTDDIRVCPCKEVLDDITATTAPLPISTKSRHTATSTTSSKRSLPGQSTLKDNKDYWQCHSCSKAHKIHRQRSTVPLQNNHTKTNLHHLHL